METEEESGPGRGFLIGLGGIGILVGVLVAAALVVPLQPALPSGCGNCTTASTSVGSTGVQVVIPPGTGSNLQLTFSPANVVLVIGVNNTVTWVNGDGQAHTVTASDSSFDSSNLPPGASWSHTFSTPGVYSYVCAYHSWMKGTVTVKTKV